MRPIVLAAVGGVGLCAAFATVAWSQGSASLPASLDRAALVSWLKANTDLDPTNVISVSPANIIGVMAVNRVEGGSGRVFRAQIRSEVISAQTIREAGNSSWAADVEVDCQTRKGKVNRILDFPQRNLVGQAREAGGSAEWVSPPPGTHLYTVVAAVCDANFQRPLAAGQQVAAAPQRPSARPPASPAQSPAQAPAAIATAPRAPAPAAQAAAPGAPAVSRAPAPAQAPPRPASSGRRSSVAVQIAAADSEAKAVRALRSAQSTFAAQLSGTAISTVPVESGGRTLYRALVHGFASTSDAEAFCAAYKAAGRDCFLRSAVPGNARAVAAR